MSTDLPTTVDPFVVEIIRNALTSAAEEMSLVVMRSARSPLLREAGDLSSALTDHEGGLIAQGHDVPVHLGVMAFTIRAFLDRVPAERLAPGDVWILNLPDVGGNHLPDVKVIRPVFAGDRLLAFSVQLAHWADIGGAAPGSYYAAATDAWMEGMRIPPTRIFAGDQPDHEKIGLILANVRGAAEREGDLLAQVAATRVAERRILEIVERHGADTVAAAMAALQDISEAQMRAAIRALPDGVYEGVDYLDDGGPGDRPVAIRVRVEISGDRARFDWSGTDDAIAGPLNTTPSIAGAAVFYVVKSLAGAAIQPNGGCYRPLEIVTRPGSVLDPGPDKPVVGGNHETSQRAVDALFMAFESVLGDRMTAGGNTSAGLLIFSGPGPHGRWATFYEPHGGGEGARIDRDGMSVVRVHLTNVMNTPVEVIEAEYLLRLERQTLRRGSGGGGAHKGGEGQIRIYEVLTDGMSLTTMFERRIVPPYGLKGGQPGAPARATLLRPDGSRTDLPGKANIALKRGDKVIFETPGGGGYGTAAGIAAAE